MLVGRTIIYFKEKKAYDEKKPPIDAVEVLSVGDWQGDYGKKIPYGFTFETTKRKVFNCTANSAADKQKWVGAIQEALDAPLLIRAEEEENQKQLEGSLAGKHQEAIQTLESLKKEQKKVSSDISALEVDVTKHSEVAKEEETIVLEKEQRYRSLSQEFEDVSKRHKDISDEVNTKEQWVQEETARIRKIIRRRLRGSEQQKGSDDDDDSEEEDDSEEDSDSDKIISQEDIDEDEEASFLKEERERLHHLRQKATKLEGKVSKAEKSLDDARDELQVIIRLHHTSLLLSIPPHPPQPLSHPDTL